MNTIVAQANALASGARARDLVEACLARIADPAGEGARAFIRVYADSARAMADAWDAMRRVGRAPRHAGIPISVKDLFDIAGEPTRAHSRVLHDAPPAARHATAVDRVLAAGFVPVGRTSMTEFAFSGLGINPLGTPLAPWDRATGHIPGGSTSGGAVSVADGMATATLGTDTGGSCRIPAAFCGITGYKPTARTVPRDGVLPLSPTLDSVGPLANSVACCIVLHAVMAGEPPSLPEPRPLHGARLLVPDNHVLDGMDAETARAFETTLKTLSDAGAIVTHATVPVFTTVRDISSRFGIASAEAFAWHRPLLESRRELYDPRIVVRIDAGRSALLADYLTVLGQRRALIDAFDRFTLPYDAMVMPTVPILPPSITALDDAAEYALVNALVLRNPSLANFLDRCAISLPTSARGSAPTAVTLMGETLGDGRLLALALSAEQALTSARDR